jgi:hypothetical protein
MAFNGNVLGVGSRRSLQDGVVSIIFRINFATLTCDKQFVSVAQAGTSGVFDVEVRQPAKRVLGLRTTNLVNGNPNTTATLRNVVQTNSPEVIQNATFSARDQASGSSKGAVIRFKVCLRNLVDGTIKTPQSIDFNLTLSER